MRQTQKDEIMSTVKFFESRGPELEAAHDECGGYVINYEHPETQKQGYLLLCSDSAAAWGVSERYTSEQWSMAGYIEEAITTPGGGH